MYQLANPKRKKKHIQNKIECWATGPPTKAKVGSGAMEE
jgi:hypothetical protein